LAIKDLQLKLEEVRLVERGMPVYEIAREEQTLESFYLSLMNGKRGT